MQPQDAYQQRVSECAHFAEQSVNEKERMTWRELALCWLRLSEYAEQFRREAKSRAAGPSGGPVDESTRGISQARRRLRTNGQVHARSRQQGDMEPDGGAMASLRRSVQEPARGRQASETVPSRRRRHAALTQPSAPRCVM